MSLMVMKVKSYSNQRWPWAAERKIKRIILTHIADTFDTSVIDEAPKYTDADVILAEDGMTLLLN